MSESADNSHSRRIGLTTGTLLIVANMIGVGVFTTTGYMVQAIPSPPAVLLAWLCGGVAAFCGALVYAELGTAISQNGGEYRFLSRIYHPAVGFVAGWVSLIVGFSAPLAAYAMAFGTYLCAAVAPEALQQQPSMITTAAGVSLIVIFAAIHSLHVATGTRFHNAFTIGKIALIATFIAAGIFRGKPALLAAESTLRASDAV